MPSSIIRARTIVTEPADRRHWHQIEDGAVLQHDGVIAEIGPAAELIAKYPGVPVLGGGRQVMLPGFDNAHHHIGLTPVQLGSPDMPLELWFVTRLVMRRVDLYLDTLYSAFEMIASGVTTVQHLHGWVPGGLEAVEASAGEVIRAYQDIGMRVSYSFACRDQNRLVYHDDKEFTASLPAELRPALRRHFARFGLELVDYGPLFEHPRARHHHMERVKIQLAAATFTGARTRRSRCSPIFRRATRRRCTCISSRPLIRKNMPPAAAARPSTTSIASGSWGRGSRSAMESGSTRPISTGSPRPGPTSATIAARISGCAAGSHHSTRSRDAASTPRSGSTKTGSTAIATSARNAHGIARAPGAGNGRRGRPEPGPSIAHGDRRRGGDHSLRQPYRHDRGRQGRRPGADRLGQARPPLS